MYVQWYAYESEVKMLKWMFRLTIIVLHYLVLYSVKTEFSSTGLGRISRFLKNAISPIVWVVKVNLFGTV